MIPPTSLQGKARINFAHVVLLLIDAPAAAARLAGGGTDRLRAFDRREANLAQMVLEEGRLLVIAPNKLDLLSTAERHAVLNAVQAQARAVSRCIMLHSTCSDIDRYYGSAPGKAARLVVAEAF
jgi:predicted GTPase